MHSYFGNDAWAPFAPGLKTLEDALGLLGYVLQFNGTEEWLHLGYNATFALGLYALILPLWRATPAGSGSATWRWSTLRARVKIPRSFLQETFIRSIRRTWTHKATDFQH